jgi:hypothetical protein
MITCVSHDQQSERVLQVCCCFCVPVIKPQGAFLDLRVFVSQSAALDLGAMHTGSIRSVAVAEVPLAGLASGAHQDWVRSQVPLVHEETGQRVGVLTLTLLAAPVLQAVARTHTSPVRR